MSKDEVRNINDETRRKVAENLYKHAEYIKDLKECPFFKNGADKVWCEHVTYRGIAHALGFHSEPKKCNYSHIVELLADLIDRPTCHDDTKECFQTFTCSSCGFSDRKIIVHPFTYEIQHIKPNWKYCPKCGAEVIE